MDAESSCARIQGFYPHEGIIDIHRCDEHASILKCLEVMSNVVSGNDRLIIMKVKQGHSESRLVAPT